MSPGLDSGTPGFHSESELCWSFEDQSRTVRAGACMGVRAANMSVHHPCVAITWNVSQMGQLLWLTTRSVKWRL